MKTYDTIIIGAGIAGLMAGRILSDANHDFICLDKKKRIGHPLKCGEGLDKKTFDNFFGKQNYNFIRNSIIKNKFVILEENNQKERLINIPYYQLDRPEFEEWMAELFKERVLLEQKVKSVKKENDYWIVQTQEFKFQAKTIILSNGCSYEIQKQIGILEKTPEIGSCYLGVFNNVQVADDEFQFLFDKTFLGYFWIFPKKDGTANLGIGALEPSKINLKEKFEHFKNTFPGLENAMPINVTGGIFPSSGPIKKTYSDGILIAGDAAGFVHPFSGEGIQYALKSGKFAAETILNAFKKNDFTSLIMQEYEKKWKQEFSHEL